MFKRPMAHRLAFRKAAILVSSTMLTLAMVTPAAMSQSAKKAAAPEPSPEATVVSSDPHATSASYGDWLLNCQAIDATSGKTCEVTQSVQVQGQAGPITRLAVSLEKPGGSFRLTLLLPTNVTLQQKPTVMADEKATAGLNVEWTRCLPGGCLATAPMPADLVKSWRAATARGRIAFQDGLGRDVALPFSLRGFSQSLDALTK